MWRGTLRERGSEAGFTLIEVVASLALMTVGLAAIGSLFATIAKGTQTLEQHVALVETARLVETSLLQRTDLWRSGVGGESSGHQWEMRISPFIGGGQAVPNSPWIPQRITIRVRSPAGAMLSLDTIRLQRGRQ